VVENAVLELEEMTLFARPVSMCVEGTDSCEPELGRLLSSSRLFPDRSFIGDGIQSWSVVSSSNDSSLPGLTNTARARDLFRLTNCASKQWN